jgi:hypothetical protein
METELNLRQPVPGDCGNALWIAAIQFARRGSRKAARKLIIGLVCVISNTASCTCRHKGREPGFRCGEAKVSAVKPMRTSLCLPLNAGT